MELLSHPPDVFRWWGTYGGIDVCQRNIRQQDILTVRYGTTSVGANILECFETRGIDREGREAQYIQRHVENE